MDLILLEKVQNLGDLGDLVKVKAGYGRNYLVGLNLKLPPKTNWDRQVPVRPVWQTWSLRLLPMRVKKVTFMVPSVLVKLHQQFQRQATKSIRAK